MTVAALSTAGFSQYIAASSDVSTSQKAGQLLEQSLAQGNLTAATQTGQWVDDLLSLSDSSNSSTSTAMADTVTAMLDSAYGLNSSSSTTKPMVALPESQYGDGSTASISSASVAGAAFSAAGQQHVQRAERRQQRQRQRLHRMVVQRSNASMEPDEAIYPLPVIVDKGPIEYS
jgi:hypothetical protein